MDDQESPGQVEYCLELHSTSIDIGWIYLGSEMLPRKKGHHCTVHVCSAALFTHAVSVSLCVSSQSVRFLRWGILADGFCALAVGG